MTKKKAKKTKKKKGFTLIELLIVIAIIGILASVVLVSLSSARDKARAANFKSQVAAMQAKAIIQCDGAASNSLTANDVSGNQPTYTVASPTNVSCGASGAGTFSVVITAVGLSASCTGTITEAGTTFNGC